MKGEKRLTDGDVAAEILPKIAEARELLASRLASLRYLWVKVDGKAAMNFSMDCFDLMNVEANLKNLEETLCRITT